MKKNLTSGLMLMSVLVLGVVSVALAKNILYRPTADAKRVISEKVHEQMPKDSLDFNTKSLAERAKDAWHDFADKHFGGDAEPFKKLGDDVIDHPRDLQKHAVRVLVDTATPSTTATREKDEVLDAKGNLRPESLVGSSVMPAMPKDVGVTEVHPGPMISPAAPIYHDPAPDRAGPAGHDGGGGRSWAGPDGKSSQVDHAGHIG